MKNILLAVAALCVVLAACKNNKPPEKKVYTRNTLVTPHNACSNLFLDSVALERFITKKVPDDTLADIMRGFYYARNFEFAWFERYSITEQGRQFWSYVSYNLSSRKENPLFGEALNKIMPGITAEDTVWATAKDSFYVNTEFMLSACFIDGLVKDGKKPTVALLEQYLPSTKTDIMSAAAAAISNHGELWLNEEAEQACSILKNELKKYFVLAQKRGWGAIGYTGKKYRKGDAAPVIALVKNRLQATGEYAGSDTSALFDTVLQTAVNRFETEQGFKPDGVITDSLLKEMNVPARQRVQQLLVNIKRLQWKPRAVAGRFITANIPEYRLHVYNDKKKVFDMDVVVGKLGTATVTFTGTLTEIVFSPYWNIPPSIIKKEILPKMAEDTGYITRQNMEIKGYKNGLPVVRQLPGPNNSLGRVKFLFNNSYNIYFHDTPAKEYFTRRKRAYSHGCIRLSDPVKMASYLLDDNKEWTPQKITDAMNSPKEIYAPVKHSVPVLITYYTAWADDDGVVNLRDDIYGHDEETAQKWFGPAK